MMSSDTCKRSLKISIPFIDGGTQLLQFTDGNIFFLLGTNGSGKSRFLSYVALQKKFVTYWIPSTRQIWMHTDKSTMHASEKPSALNGIDNMSRTSRALIADDMASKRLLYRLHCIAEDDRARDKSIANAVDNGDYVLVEQLKRKPSLSVRISEILQNSKMPISLTVTGDMRLLASKRDCPAFSSVGMSDGERNALLICTEVLSAPPRTVFLIDEPEIHMHKSIVSSFLNQLFSHRDDCSFFIATHDHTLPSNFPSARVIYFHAVSFTSSPYPSFRFKEIPNNSNLYGDHLTDLLGSRESILFVEGEESSYDKPLYSLLFPNTRIVPRDNKRSVMNSVSCFLENESMHWVKCFGIVDRDGINDGTENVQLKCRLYVLPFYSIESIFLHPEIIELAAKEHAKLLDEDSSEMYESAVQQAIDAIKQSSKHLCRKRARRLAGRMARVQIPSDDELLESSDIPIKVDGPSLLREQYELVNGAIESKDLVGLLKLVAVKESGAIEAVRIALKFTSKDDYIGCIRKLLSSDDVSLAMVRGWFGDLYERLEQSKYIPDATPKDNSKEGEP